MYVFLLMHIGMLGVWHL